MKEALSSWHLDLRKGNLEKIKEIGIKDSYTPRYSSKCVSTTCSF